MRKLITILLLLCGVNAGAQSLPYALDRAIRYIPETQADRDSLKLYTVINGTLRKVYGVDVFGFGGSGGGTTYTGNAPVVVNGSTISVDTVTGLATRGWLYKALDSLAFMKLGVGSTTTVIPEGTNLYYTDARARNAISVTGSGSYNTATGVININAPNAALSPIGISGSFIVADTSSAPSGLATKGRLYKALDSLKGTIPGATSYTGNAPIVVSGSTISADTAMLATRDRVNKVADSTLSLVPAIARNSISVTGNGSYNSTTGVINITGSSVDPNQFIQNQPWNAGTAQTAQGRISGRFRTGGELITDSTLQLGTLATLPAGANGEVAYNNTTAKFNFYENGIWKTYLAGGDVITGNTIYVDKNSTVSTDTRTGLSKYSLDRPFKTIAAALSVYAAGDVIWVSGGTYTESLTFPLGLTMVIENSTITAAGDHTIKLNGTNAVTNIIGLGEARINNTGSTGLAVFNIVQSSQNLTLRNIIVNGNGHFATVTAGGFTAESFYYCSITVNGNFIPAPVASTQQVVNIYYTDVYSATGNGINLPRSSIADVAIVGSTIDVQGYVLDWLGTAAGSTAALTIKNSTLTSRNSYALNTSMWNASSITHLIENSTIVQNTASSFGSTHGTNASADTYRLRNVVFSTASGTTAYNRNAGAANSSVMIVEGVVSNLPFPATTQGTYNPIGRLKMVIGSVPTYADDAAAGTGGLTQGEVYKTSTGQLMIKL